MSGFINRNRKHIVYGICTLVITFIIVMTCWRMWGTDIKVPLTGYRSDSVGTLLEANNYVRGGFLHSCVTYGAPYQCEYIGGGFGDSSVYMPFIKFIWKITGSIEAGINIQAILNILMLALSTFCVCIHFKISDMVSMVLGVSYATMSYFLMYGNTLLMIYSFCFYIPIVCCMVIEIMRTDNIDKAEKHKLQLTWKQIIFTVSVMLFMGINSAYYVFMVFIILAFVLLHTLFVTRCPKRVLMVILAIVSVTLGVAVYTVPKVMASMGYKNMVVDIGSAMFPLLLTVAVILTLLMGWILKRLVSFFTMKRIYITFVFFIGIAGLLFVFVKKYTDYFGAYDGRTWLAVEMGALRIINMIMPAPNNILPAANNTVQALVDVNKGDYTVMGLLAGIGYLYSVVNIFQFKKNKKVFLHDEILHICGVMNGFMTIVTVKGGFASLIAMFVTTGIRNYNRIYVFVAVFSLISFGILVEKVILLVKNSISLKCRKPVLICLSVFVVFGLCVSIPTYFVYKNLYGIPDYEQRVEDYNEWHDIMYAIEESVPEGAMILQLPFSVSDERIGILMEEQGRAYDLQVPVILSKSTVWSYGGGYKGNRWKRVANKLETMEELLIQASAFGFDGVYLDALMYDDNSYMKVIKELERILGNPYVCPDNRRYFFNMSDYNNRILSEYGEEGIAEIISQVEAQYQEGK